MDIQGFLGVGRGGNHKEATEYERALDHSIPRLVSSVLQRRIMGGAFWDAICVTSTERTKNVE